MFEATRRARALVAAGVALILVSPFLTVVPAQAASLVPVVIDLSKTTTAPGDGIAGANEVVTFGFTVTCSSTQSDCVNMVLTDTFPQPLVFDSVNTNSNYDIAVIPNGFELTFKNVLDEDYDLDGNYDIGLVAGETVSFEATGHVVSDVDASFDGDTVVNTAVVVVSNPDSGAEASDDVVIEAPLVVRSTITKTVVPDSLTGFVGVPVAFNLSATNTSNATVDTMQISDPAEAVLPTNAYEYLTVSSLSNVVFPSGANLVQVDYYNGTAWTNGTPAATAVLPAVPLTSIKGLRFTFSNSNPSVDIARSATGSVRINTVTNAATASLVTPFLGHNIASSLVVRGPTPGTIVSADAPFTITPAAIAPVAIKAFSDRDVVGGEDITATLTAQNGGDFTLTELAIVEPETATTSFADQGFDFVAINQAQVFWPTGATSVDMTYVYADGVGPLVNGTARDTLPAPDPLRTVIGFTANFKGSMTPGQYATVPFTVHTLPVFADISTTNTIRVDARTATQSASATASDTLVRRSSRINTTIDKQIAPGSIFATANAPLMLTLRSQIDPRPTLPGDTGGSTIGATQFEVTDDDADFWEIFNPTNIVATEVPSGSTLQILYETNNGTAYPLTNVLVAPTVGPALINYTIPGGLVSTITGIKFVYTPTTPGTLLQPGFNVQPNIKVRLRTTERTSGDPVFAPGATVARIENNTATSFVINTETGQFDDDDDPAPVTVQPAPADGGPGYDLIEKAWVEDEVLARSSQTATTNINWGTGGQEYNSVVITDTPAPTTAAISSTVYDSFDLFSIAPITTATDPLIAYDSVSAVQYFSRTTNQWEPLNDTNANLCTLAPCNGSFPGYTLSAAERADAIGVRLIFIENPNRLTPTTAAAPLQGSGVAATTALNRRISLVFQLRTVLRTNAGVAVLGTSRGQFYNTATAGQVNNVAGIEGRDAANVVLWDEEDNDEILILDSSLNVIATKTWIDDPLGVPPVGTDQALFPIALMTVTAQNASVVPVNELKLEEPTGGTTPFDYVTIVQIEKLTGSTDNTSTAVLEYENGTFSASIPINTLVTYTSTQLQDVVGLTLTKAGPIATSEIIGLQIHTQLREFVRGTAVRTAPMTLNNETTATVTDPGGTTTPPVSTAPNNVVVDEATASIDIEAWSYGAVANKSISTTTLEYGGTSSTSTTGVSAPSNGPGVAVPGVPGTAAIQYDNGEAISSLATVTVSGQPTGNVRTTDLVLEDVSPTFWNVYNFVSLNATPLSDTRKRVQVDVLIGNGSWGYGIDYDTSSGISAVCTGSCWVTGTPSLTPTLPTMPPGSLVTDIRGLRFTFTNADGSAWERPYNPPMTAIFTVERRLTLVSDNAEPVPSTLFTYTGPTPGETQQGVFTNSVTATASARSAPGVTPLWTASADASAQVRYQHLPARVRIKKSPTGAQSLNTDIPYKIVVTNTGGSIDRELGDVVVIDSLPVDTVPNPDVAQLVVPNDVDGEPQSITSVVSIRVADASNATLPAPTFTATLMPMSGSTQDIVFDFDDAWVLPRQATLTITANLQFTPQLEAGTLVTNTATVTADQPFETCQWYINNATVAEPTQNEVDECSSSTTVYPLASAPVTIVKGVRGVEAGPLDSTGTPIDSDTITPGIQPYDDLGILKTVPGSSVSCNTPNVATGIIAEYYRYPCVPITRPGGIEEWASTFTNGGNIGLTEIVAIDVLPVQNDRGVIVNEARGTKWTPTLTTYPTLVNLPTDATYTVYYVTDRAIASQRCNGADIQATLGMVPNGTPIPMTAGYVTCYNNAAPVDSVASRNAAWQVLSPSADAATLASVVAMKFVVNMTTANPLLPGTKLSIVYRSQTSSVIQIAETGLAIDNQSVAYNSIAAAAAGIDPSNPGVEIPNRFVTEPRKVGVAMATGSFEISKSVTGGAGFRSQASFDVTLNCTSAGTTLAPRVVNVPKDTTVIVHGLPLYASCTVTEAPTYNQNLNTSSITPGTVTAQAPQGAGAETIFDPNPVFNTTARPNVERSTVVNDYPMTTFTISKVLNINGAVDAEVGGNPVYPSDIRFSASCTFNHGGPTSTTPPLNPVNVLNVTGIDLDPATDPTPYTSPSIPVGSICTVSETSSRGAQSTTRIITVNGVAGAAGTGAAVFTVDDSGNSVAFTNNYGVSSLTVNKTVTGAWATSHTTGPFVVTVNCTRNINAPSGLETTFSGTVTFPIPVPPPVPPALPDPPIMTKTFNNIAQGSLCTITETDPAGATRTTITNPLSSNPTASAPTALMPTSATAVTTQTRTVTNYFDEASLSVTKEVHTDALDGNGDVVYLDAPYTVNVSCTFEGVAVFATGYSASPMVLTFTEAELANVKIATKPLSGLPAGALCNVVETPTPANADSVRIDWNAGAANGTSPTTSAVVGPLAADGVSPAAIVTNFARVHNYYDVGHFTVTKSLRGDASTAFGLGPFTVHVECVAGGLTTYEGDIELTPTQLTVTIDDIAVGSECSAVETGVGRSAPDAVVYIDAFGDMTDGAGVDVMATNPLVTIQNWYLTGSLVVTKDVVESAGYTFGTGPFEIELTCERGLTSPVATVTTTVTRTMDPGTPSSMTQTFTDLPNGATCTLRETDDGNASSTSITNGTSTSTVAATGITFVVELDETILSVVDQAQPAITVTNNFTEAALRVLKTIDSAAVDANGDPLTYGPFDVTVSCLFNGTPTYGTGYSLGSPMSESLTPGIAWDIVGLPTGADCTVTEDNVLGAVSTTVTTVAADVGGAPDVVTPPTTPTTTLILGPLSTTNSVTFDNAFEVGSIDLSKAILGSAETKWGTADFTVSVVCELVDASTRLDDTVFDDVFDRVELLAGVTIDNLPTGAECTITETNTGVATGTEIVVTEPLQTPVTTTGDTVTVTVTNDATAIDVVVNNTFEYASITVQKERNGDSTGLYDVGPFEVTLACTFDGYTLVDSDIPDGLVRELTFDNTYFTSYTNLPVGADCTVTETNTGGANSTEMRLGPAPAATTPGITLALTTTPATSEVYAINDYELGSLAVSKTVSGFGSPLYGDGSDISNDNGLDGYEVTLSCERLVDSVWTPVVLPYAAEYTLLGTLGYTHTFTDLPVGAVCEISETKKGFATISTVGPPVTITADLLDPATIDIVNEYTLGVLSLNKESLGLYASEHAGEAFEITVECWQDVDGTLTLIDPITDGSARTIRAGEVTEFVDLPVPATCTFEETIDGGANLHVYSVSAVPMIGSDVTVDPGTVDVQLDNLFLLSASGSNADVWIIGALISLLSGVCLVVVGRRRQKVATHST